MDKESDFININERFELVAERFYNKIVWTYTQFIEKSRDKEYAKTYFSELSPLVFGMPNDEFSLQLYELFNHEYKIGTSIDKIIEQALILRSVYNRKLKDNKTNEFSIDNFEIDSSSTSINNEPTFVPITSSFFEKDDTNPNTYFKFFVAYQSKTSFLYFILREQNDVVSKETLQGLLPLVAEKIFIDNPNGFKSSGDSNDIGFDIENKINWLGTQKELGELFVELLQKGWIAEINAKKIQALFSKSNTISQVIKPSGQLIPDEQGNKKLENQYEQIYTAKYQPKFDTIRKNPKKKS
jgi:hypothetical protein